eukprot:RCo055141
MNMRQRCFTSYRFNTANTGSNTVFTDDFKETNITCMFSMCTTTQFSREIAHLNYTDFFTILLTEQCHSATGFRIFQRHQLSINQCIFANFRIHTLFNLT